MRVKATMLRTTPNGLFRISSSFRGYTGRGADDWGHVPGTSGQSPQCPALHLANAYWIFSARLSGPSSRKPSQESSSPCCTWYVSVFGSFSLEHDNFPGDLLLQAGYGCGMNAGMNE